jgi:hypothetical protein
MNLIMVWHSSPCWPVPVAVRTAAAWSSAAKPTWRSSAHRSGVTAIGPFP